MATYTENYNLEKPAQSDLYNIDVFNENADKIDEALGDKAENQSLAPIESSATASRNYSVGQQFVYNGLLYEATSAIASGGTITPGSNCARTTVAEELSALNDSLTYKEYSASYSISVNSNNGLHAYRVGNLAVVSGFFNPTSEITANKKIGQVSNYSGISEAYATLLSSSNKLSRIALRTNGRIDIEASLSSNQYYSFTLVAVLA